MIRRFLSALAILGVCASSAPASAGPAQLVVRLDHTTVRAGGVVSVVIENRGTTPIVISYAGGTSGCAVPQPEAYWVDASQHFGPTNFRSVLCTAVMVPPGQIEIAPGTTRAVTSIDTNAVPDDAIALAVPGRPMVTQKLAPGVYQIGVRFGGVVAQPATLVIQ